MTPAILSGAALGPTDIPAMQGVAPEPGRRPARYWCRYALLVAEDVIIGQQRVVALLAFFAAPFLLLAIPGDVVALFVGSVALGVFLLFVVRLRSVGVGLLAGTVVTLGALLLLGTMLSGVD